MALCFSIAGIRHDANLTLPIRQTASIFKQPVTVIKRQDSTTKTDLKHGPQDPPRQVKPYLKNSGSSIYPSA